MYGRPFLFFFLLCYGLMIRYLYGLFHEISHPPMRVKSGGACPLICIWDGTLFSFLGHGLKIRIYSGVIVLVHRDIQKPRVSHIV